MGRVGVGTGTVLVRVLVEEGVGRRVLVGVSSCADAREVAVARTQVNIKVTGISFTMGSFRRSAWSSSYGGPADAPTPGSPLNERKRAGFSCR